MDGPQGLTGDCVGKTKKKQVKALATQPKDDDATKHKIEVTVPVILIQAGHVGRTKGVTGAEGSYGSSPKVTVTEQSIADAVATRAANLIRTCAPAGVEVHKYDADNVPKFDSFLLPIAAVAIHCNGAGSSSARGYCFGWPPSHEKVTELRDSLEKAYLAAQAASWLGETIPHEGKDNYNANLSSYYVWRKLPEKSPGVLIELGYLSNEKDCEAVDRNRSAIGRAVAAGVIDFVKASWADEFPGLSDFKDPPSA